MAYTNNQFYHRFTVKVHSQHELWSHYQLKWAKNCLKFFLSFLHENTALEADPASRHTAVLLLTLILNKVSQHLWNVILLHSSLRLAHISLSPCEQPAELPIQQATRVPDDLHNQRAPPPRAWMPPCRRQHACSSFQSLHGILVNWEHYMEVRMILFLHL